MTFDVDLVVIGNLLLDQFPDGEVRAGGAALFTALAARAAGLRVGVHSVVGTDFPTKLLSDRGVQLSLQRLPHPGGRTLITYRGDERTLEHCGPGHEAMTPQTPHPFRARFVHLAPMPRKWQLFHLSQADPETAFLDPYPEFSDGYLEEVLPLAQRLRYLILNEQELQCDLSQIPKCLPVLLKQGPRGGVCLSSGERWQAQSVKVVDPTGAGDSFVAGLVAGMVQEVGLQRSLEMGAELAAKVISRSGVEAFLDLRGG